MSRQILLVEDDAAIMDTLAIFLNYEGFEVVKARSVSHALHYLNENQPDIVLLDYMLQDDTAEPVVKVLRDRFPEIPIVLLTAVDDPSGKGKLLGVDAVVSKPFELEVLVESLKGALQDKTLAAILNSKESFLIGAHL